MWFFPPWGEGTLYPLWVSPRFTSQASLCIRPGAERFAPRVSLSPHTSQPGWCCSSLLSQRGKQGLQGVNIDNWPKVIQLVSGFVSQLTWACWLQASLSSAAWLHTCCDLKPLIWVFKCLQLLTVNITTWTLSFCSYVNLKKKRKKQCSFLYLKQQTHLWQFSDKFTTSISHEWHVLQSKSKPLMLKYVRMLLWNNNENGYHFLRAGHTKCFMVVTLIHPDFSSIK